MTIIGCASGTILKSSSISTMKTSVAAKEMAHAQDFEGKLFEEIKGTIQANRYVGAVQTRRLFHYTRYEQGKEYPIYARKRGSLDRPEEIMLDVNLLADGHEFFSIGGSAVSAGQNLLAYAVDTQGRRIHTTLLEKPDYR